MFQCRCPCFLLFAALYSHNNRSACDTAHSGDVFLVSDQIGEKHEDSSHQTAEIHFSRAEKIRKIMLKKRRVQTRRL